MHADPNFDIGRFLGDPETSKGMLLSMAQAVAGFAVRYSAPIITAMLTAGAVASVQYLLIIPRIEEREVRTDARLAKLETRANAMDDDNKKLTVLVTELKGSDQVLLEKMTHIDERLRDHMSNEKPKGSRQ